MFVSEYFKKRMFRNKNIETNVEENEEIILEKFKEEIANEIGINLIEKIMKEKTKSSL